jgi:hypothetical protein
MASNSNQIVLFDGDEDRSKIFEDIKQLSKIPSPCKFYIFCNEPEIIQRKILLHPSNISGVSVRQSSNGKSIEEFLNKEIDNYSFILVVCGPNSCYVHLFPGIWKKYGRKKLFVMGMKNQSDISMKNILVQLGQHKTSSNSSKQIINDQGVFRNHTCIKCGQSFFSGDDLQKHEKDFHGLISTTELYMDSTTNFSSHKKTNENNKLITEFSITCSICNHDFNTNGDLKDHIKQMHSDLPTDDYE